jgi:hypothetical protein
MFGQQHRFSYQHERTHLLKLPLSQAVSASRGCMAALMVSPHARVCCLQIYVFCCAHAAQVEAYLQQSHWLSERHCKVRAGGGTDS